MSSPAEWFAQAWQYHQANQITEAEQLYRQTLESDPAHAEAWCFLGVLWQGQGRFAEAETCLRRALLLIPSYASAQNWLGMVLAQQGRWGEAVGTFEHLVATHPGDAEAWHNLGTAYLQQGSHNEAVTALERALQLRSDFPAARAKLDAIHQQKASVPDPGLPPQDEEARTCVAQGLALIQQGQLEDAAAWFQAALQRHPHNVEAAKSLGDIRSVQGKQDEAIAHYQQALRHHPGYADAHYNLGCTLQAQGHVEEAIASYEQTLAIAPHHLEAWINLGHMRQRRGDFAGAAEAFTHVLRMRPDFAAVHVNLGNVYSAARDWVQAEGCLREGLRLDPHRPEVHNGLGIVLARKNKISEAMECFQRALELQPRFAEALSNLGIAWKGQGCLDESLRCHEEALRIKPDYAEAHFNRGLILLLHGHFEEGWPEYEWRGQTTDHLANQSALPKWDGSSLVGRTILLRAEQGLGDTIQFLRYAPLVKDRGGTVVVECQPALAPLAATCSGVDGVLPKGSPQPCVDVSASLLSLPSIFATTRSTIPTKVPYLHPDSARVEHWRQELATERRFKVGLVWQGNSQYRSDRQRSVPLRQFAPLAEVAGVVLFSLQFGEGIEQLADAGFPLIDLGSRAAPLENLAALLVNLDLLITVDTAPAHLAGALGRPFWLALTVCPHWPWLLEGSESLWYPTARLFRQQEAGNWEPVFAGMTTELRRVLGA